MICDRQPEWQMKQDCAGLDVLLSGSSDELGSSCCVLCLLLCLVAHNGPFSMQSSIMCEGCGVMLRC